MLSGAEDTEAQMDVWFYKWNIFNVVLNIHYH